MTSFCTFTLRFGNVLSTLTVSRISEMKDTPLLYILYVAAMIVSNLSFPDEGITNNIIAS